MTTVLSVRKAGQFVLAADGQVTLGNTAIKHSATKLRKLNQGKVIAGFAGSTADAFTLFDRFEAKLSDHTNNLVRAAVELSKDWRTDKYLSRLEAMLLVGDAERTLLISGSGDIVEPEHGAAAIGSGGNFALSAALALLEHSDLDAEAIARQAMKIASQLCIYSNDHLSLLNLNAHALDTHS